MKSLTAVCQTGASMPAINPNGRINRHPPHRGDGENAEMKMYLSKLKDLVPFMPKNRKLSKLEIIQHVIDYICDLQSELETHPEINNFDASAALSFATNNLDRIAAASDDADEDMQHEDDEDGSSVQERLNAPEQQQQQQQQQQYYYQQQHQQPSPAQQRQPLVDRQTPNTILPPASQQQQQPQRQMNAYTSAAVASSQNHGSSSAAVTPAAVTGAAVSSTTHTLSGEKDMNSRQSC